MDCTDGALTKLEILLFDFCFQLGLFHWVLFELCVLESLGIYLEDNKIMLGFESKKDIYNFSYFKSGFIFMFLKLWLAVWN